MNMPMYDPEKCTITINSRVITGWNEASAEHDQERHTGHRSGDGLVYVGKDPCKLGTIRIVLPLVNGHTAYFDNLALSDKPFPASIIDHSDATRSARGSQCLFKKSSSMERRGKDPTEETWELLAEDLTFGYQRDRTDDVVSLPVDDGR